MFDRATLASLGAGAGLAVVVLLVPWLRFALSYLTYLVHELGHALVGLLFGYPSIPAFDFVYGGGITTLQRRSGLLVGLVYLVLAGLIVSWRRNRPALVALCALAGLYALCAHTAAHKVLILFMGHGMELAIAGVFLYRALSGSAVLHAAERPLYAMCGFFIVLADVAFAWRLWRSPHARALYGAAKGGGHWMDFSRIAERHLGVDVAAVAFFFLLCCALPLVVSFVLFRYRDRAFGALARLLEREPEFN